MQEIIASIRDAVSKECWIPALALALTIPDALGQIAHPEFVNKKGRPLVSKQYKAWFSENVEHCFADASGFNEDGTAKKPYFTANMCYLLRCALLHSNKSDIDFEFGDKEDGAEYSYTFGLWTNACNSYGKCWAEDGSVSEGGSKRRVTVNVTIDVKTLCDVLCDSAERYLLKNNSKVVGADCRVRVTDVKRELERIGWK